MKYNNPKSPSLFSLQSLIESLQESYYTNVEEVAGEWGSCTAPPSLCLGEWVNVPWKGCGTAAIGAYIPFVAVAAPDLTAVATAAACSGGTHIPPTTTN